MPDTKHVANIAILNMARFGTEMVSFRFMLNSGISLIALLIIYYNTTKKHRGNGGRTKVEMEAGLGAEWGRNEGYGCRYFAGRSGLEPPCPFHKQCLAY